jgi:uncharacterized cofD-like protein
MKYGFKYRLESFMLPGLKRWILFIMVGIILIVFGVFLVLGYHPITVSGLFLREVMEHAADVLPHRISGLLVIVGGLLVVVLAIARMTVYVVGAYLPEDRESIPDVLYRRQFLGRGPKVVVIGGGTGLATLLKGIKQYTNNIAAIVTVGDDGGSSGRLRQEFGVLPPGDIRNCITALADEEKLVTELFRYRFGAGQVGANSGLEGHSFGNLFLAAICAITGGDMVQAVKVAARILNSRGQVIPSTLTSINLVAQMKDGQIIKGESHIAAAQGQIEKLKIEPEAHATPEAIAAISEADLIIIGPGSLYTSVIPNLLVEGIGGAILASHASKVYVCNIMTQAGETIDYSVSDHILAILSHANVPPKGAPNIMQTVLVNDQKPDVNADSPFKPVVFDKEKVSQLGVAVLSAPLLSTDPASPLYLHDPQKLAQVIMLSIHKDKKQNQPVITGVDLSSSAESSLSLKN